MRVTIEIEEKLMQLATELSGAKSRRATVEAALKLLVRLKRQEDLMQSRGRVQIVGELGDGTTRRTPLESPQ
jgi:Arc/MetJ family transcription regulator